MMLESPRSSGVVGFWVPGSCGTPDTQASCPELPLGLASQEQTTVTKVTGEMRPLEPGDESPQTE